MTYLVRNELPYRNKTETKQKQKQNRNKTKTKTETKPKQKQKKVGFIGMLLHNIPSPENNFFFG